MNAKATGRPVEQGPSGFRHLDIRERMFKVFVGFMRQLAYNYQKGIYNDRNEWASRLASEAYTRLIESDLIYDPNFNK